MDDATCATLRDRLVAARQDVDVPPLARRAAVAAALRVDSDGRDLEVLLMRRAERPSDRWSGQISLPGGHVDPGDRDEVAAAIRETDEEVGLDLVRDADVLGTLTPIQALARGRRVDLWITPVVFRYRGAGALALGPEADDAFWLPLGPAGRGELDAEHRYEHEGVVVPLPSWRYGERVVWGLTHKILGELLRVMA
ncbi:MAG: CoA pyrophosphatase [Planctomycetota bacterium]